MARRALVVHATNLLVRGLSAVAPDRRSESGEPTNALFASAQALRRALAFKSPDLAVAVVDASFDVSTCPPLLVPQLGRLPSLLEALGFRVVSSDDGIAAVASFVRAAVEAGCDVVVVGSDKRLAQLVSARVWWYDPYKDVRYTPELVRKRFEVEPAHVAGWLALAGDDDSLPGIKGIGKKGATSLVEAFGSVERALEHPDAVEGRTGKMLRESLEPARAEVARARLEPTAPLVPLEGLVYTPPGPSALNDTYGALGFFELLESDGAAASPAPIVCDTVEAAAEAIAAFGDHPTALQVVTEDPSAARGALVGLAVASGDRCQYYFPLSGVGRCLPGPAVLARWLGDRRRPKVGHDIKAAVVAFARLGIPVEGIVGDSACASHLAEPSNLAPHDLPTVARQVLRRPVEDPEAVRGVGRAQRPWAAVPIERTAGFAAQWADAALALWDALAPTTPPALLQEYLALSETLVRMELCGIACDAKDLARAGDDFAEIGAELEAEIFRLAKRSFNLGSTKQLGTVLYEDLGLPIVKRTKTGWSTATEALERIEHAHPIVSLVIRWRLLQRLRDSWVTALSASIDGDGRVRSTSHPARSFSGRLVNSSPDLGRVPGKTPEMVRIRSAFRAPPGKTLLSVDYNQLGLYVLAHLTRDPALCDPLREGGDLHTLTAAAILDRPAGEIGPDERQIGKVVNFATFAGQGASALALQLGMTAQVAKELIARFDRHYAGVRAFQEDQLRIARERGFIETLAGRRWPIGGLSSLDQHALSYAERMARRATHEGSVADVSRRGLLAADRALRAAGLQAAPLLQVHDEVLFEVATADLAESARVAADAMRTAFDLEVPLRVGCKAGPSWGELDPLPV